MFKEYSSLGLSLLYRAINTERNTVERMQREHGGFEDQLAEINKMLFGIDMEYLRRYDEQQSFQRWAQYLRS